MFTNETVGLDGLEVGQEWESPARQVTRADIDAFAHLTGDLNPIHIDPEFARSTPFRQCIAHGLLGLSFAAGLIREHPPVRTVAFLGLREWRFLAPVFPGDVIRVRSRVLAKELRGRGRRGVVVWRVSVLSQSGQVVQEGVTETVVEAGREATAWSSGAGHPAA
jgi:acyl dehydratase